MNIHFFLSVTFVSHFTSRKLKVLIRGFPTYQLVIREENIVTVP